MGRKRGARRRGGWRRKDGKIQVYVRLHSGKGGFATQLFPLDTDSQTLQQWINDLVAEYRHQHPRPMRGTLSSDVPVYLKHLVNRPQLQQERELQLMWWCQQFGQRSRHSLQPIELETALNELLAAGAAASTVKHYRTALYHLFTKLDGRNAPNPLRDVPPPREPDPLPRAIPYEIIDEIFRFMAQKRHAQKIDAPRAALICAAAVAPGANRSAIAKSYGITETMVRKIVNRKGQRADRFSQSKARLQMMAYIGLPPAQIRLIDRSDINLEAATILVHGRKKGGGSRPALLPLTPRGVDACRSFIAADCFERLRPDGTRTGFSSTPPLRAWRGAINRMCAFLERESTTRGIGEELRRELANRTPYDLRHSFLTEVQLATGNIRATQKHALHADSKMTDRYTLAAVTPELETAAKLLALRLVGNETATTGDPELTEIHKTNEKSTARLIVRSAAKQAAKP